ncbi:MAG: hypothetical protein JNJ60_23510 [Rhodocyclaceae bacterium]|nr:hypothetical protein [Rhodocyclaceae bacterium]
MVADTIGRPRQLALAKACPIGTGSRRFRLTISSKHAYLQAKTRTGGFLCIGGRQKQAMHVEKLYIFGVINQ